MSRRLRSRKIVHIGRPRNAFYHVRVFYDGGIINWLEDGLFAAASGKPKGRTLSNSSGCCMFPPYTRDHEWDFVKLNDADACYARIHKFLFGQHNHQMPKRRVELWDETPRLISAEKRPGFVMKPRIPGGSPKLRRNRSAA